MIVYVGIDMAKHDFMSAVELEDNIKKQVHPKLKNTSMGCKQLKIWIENYVAKHNVNAVVEI